MFFHSVVQAAPLADAPRTAEDVVAAAAIARARQSVAVSGLDLRVEFRNRGLLSAYNAEREELGEKPVERVSDVPAEDMRRLIDAAKAADAAMVEATAAAAAQAPTPAVEQPKPAPRPSVGSFFTGIAKAATSARERIAALSRSSADEHIEVPPPPRRDRHERPPERATIVAVPKTEPGPNECWCLACEVSHVIHFADAYVPEMVVLRRTFGGTPPSREDLLKLVRCRAKTRGTGHAWDQILVQEERIAALVERRQIERELEAQEDMRRLEELGGTIGDIVGRAHREGRVDTSAFPVASSGPGNPSPTPAPKKRQADGPRPKKGEPSDRRREEERAAKEAERAASRPKSRAELIAAAQAKLAAAFERAHATTPGMASTRPEGADGKKKGKKK